MHRRQSDFFTHHIDNSVWIEFREGRGKACRKRMAGKKFVFVQDIVMM